MKELKCTEPHPFVEDELLQHYRISDYKANYAWKTRNPFEEVNPSLAKPNENFKPFFEKKIKFHQRPMLPLSSVTHSDFLWKPDPPSAPDITITMPGPVCNSIVSIDRNKPGYGKYLDPQATTQRLDYCYRSPNDIAHGISAHDNITFWNWKHFDFRSKKVSTEKPSKLCDKSPSIDCEQRRGEFISQVKRVPYTGMTTEIRENYTAPATKAGVKHDDIRFPSDVSYKTGEMIPRTTEYSIIGSGDRTEKFV